MTTANSATLSPANAASGPDLKKGLSGSTIKLIAIIAMLIDHTAATILERMMMRAGYALATLNNSLMSTWIAKHPLLYFSYMVMRLIGRFGFPIFCFLLVEGFLHTHNRVKYALRLFLFALISEIPFDLAFRGKWFYTKYQNVFFTLFIGLITMYAFSFFEERLKRLKGGVRGMICLIIGIVCAGCYGSYLLDDITYALFGWFLDSALSDFGFWLVFAVIYAAVAAVILIRLAKKHSLLQAQIIGADLAVLCLMAYAADLLMTDYAGLGVITIALMYAFRQNRQKSMLAGCICLTVMEVSEATAFLMLIPISKYNGTRGLNLKYVFYAFYPVHLAVLYVICVLMGLA